MAHQCWHGVRSDTGIRRRVYLKGGAGGLGTRNADRYRTHNIDPGSIEP